MLCADPRRFLKEARCWGFAHSTSDVLGGCLSPPSWYPCHSHPSPPPRPFQYIPPKATDLGKQGPPHFPAQLPLRSSAAHARGHAIMHILPYLFIKKPKQNPLSLSPSLPPSLYLPLSPPPSLSVSLSLSIPLSLLFSVTCVQKELRSFPKPVLCGVCYTAL